MDGLQAVKAILVLNTGLAKDALHIYVALGLFLGSCLIFGWKTRQWKPWMLVLLAAVVGEIWDISDQIWHKIPVDLLASRHDIWNTMLVPTVLMILSRYSTIFAAKPAAAEESGDQP